MGGIEVAHLAITERHGKRGTTYGVSVYDATTNRTVWLGTYKSEREAKRAEKAYKPNIRRDLTLADFVDEWTARQSHLKPTTVEHYQYALTHAVTHMGDRRLRDIDYRMVSDFAGRLTADLSPLTARTAFGVLQRVLEDAVRSKLIDENPASGVDNLPRRRRSREIRPLTREEHQALVALVDPHYRNLVAVWPLLGLRSGEIVGLKAEDVTANGLLVCRQVIRGEERKPKGDKERRVPLLPEARALLESQMAAESCAIATYLFHTEQGSRITMERFWYLYVKPHLTALGIEGVTPHTMRHTYATWLIHAGVNISQVAAACGHSSPTITLSTYSHLMPDSDDEIVDRLSKFLSTKEE